MEPSMRSVVVAKSGISFAAFLTVFANILSGIQVYAAGTTVSTQVCNPTSGSTAQISITTPADDSVVDQNTVTLSGIVKDVTQIDVTIDGTYDKTLAVANGQTSYSTTVSLAVGTHTIKVTGNDICGITDPSDSAVVTYELNTPPSTGTGTPTTTPTNPSSPGGGTITSPGATPARSPVESPAMSWLKNVPGYDIAVAVGRSVDFDTLGRDGLLKAILRFILFTFGVALLLLGPLVMRSIEHTRRVSLAALQYVNNSSTGKFVSHLQRNTITSRLIGLVLLIVAFTI